MSTPSRRSRAQITLARALSKFGFSSRSKAAVLIRDGHVQVHGRVIRDPDHWLDPRTARIDVDGTRLVAQEFRYVAMHKPRGYVTTRADERGRDTVYALLPPDMPWLFPVGRLDKDTSGLLLFTNDVRWGEMLTSPDHRVQKTYEVTVDRPVEERDLDVMRNGMMLDDGTELLPVGARRIRRDGCTIVLTLTEGKNRQVRRMLAHFRYEVVSLVRTAIGTITLKGLAAGQVRPITAEERRRIGDIRTKEKA